VHWLKTSDIRAVFAPLWRLVRGPGKKNDFVDIGVEQHLRQL
jgi:hypothetical protein